MCDAWSQRVTYVLPDWKAAAGRTPHVEVMEFPFWKFWMKLLLWDWQQKTIWKDLDFFHIPLISPNMHKHDNPELESVSKWVQLPVAASVSVKGLTF